MKQVQRLRNRARDLLFVPALDRYWRGKLRGHIICLLYHRVDSPENNAFLTLGGSPVIRPSDLEEELRFLKRQGATFLTFADLRKGVLPDGDEFGVIVSFDDCFLDNYTNGLEVLESLGIKAIFFQTTGMIEPGELIWEHVLYWLNRDPKFSLSFAALAHRVLASEPGIAGLSGTDLVFHLRENLPAMLVRDLLSCAKHGLCSDGELAEVSHRVYARTSHVQAAYRMGHEIGSHGHRHFKRANIDDETFDKELALSASTLTQVLGAPPGAFSYPFNSYRVGDASICSRYFQQAATVDMKIIGRTTDPMWLPRFSWPGPAKTSNRRRRWLLTGRI